MIDGFTGLAIVVVAALAGWFDVRERRIPNALTVPAFGVALGVALFGGVPGLGASLAGAAICLAVSLPFFAVRGLGGGDVKLLVAFGAFLGPSRLAPALVVTAFVGGALGLYAMVRQGAVRRTFRNLYWMGVTLFARASGRQTVGSGVWPTLDSKGAVTVPYGVAIAAGALYAWFL